MHSSYFLNIINGENIKHNQIKKGFKKCWKKKEKNRQIRYVILDFVRVTFCKAYSGIIMLCCNETIPTLYTVK